MKKPQGRENKPVETRKILGVLLLSIGILLTVALFSFLLNWQQDQSQLHAFLDKTVQTENLLGKAGNIVGDILMRQGIGLASFLLAFFLILLGLRTLSRLKRIVLRNYVLHASFFIFWLPLALSIIIPQADAVHGIAAYETKQILQALVGLLGFISFLIISFTVYCLVFFYTELSALSVFFSNLFYKKNQHSTPIQSPSISDIQLPRSSSDTSLDEIHSPLKEKPILPKEFIPVFPKTNQALAEDSLEEPVFSTHKITTGDQPSKTLENGDKAQVEMTVETLQDDDEISAISNKLVAEYGAYDPALDLPSFQMPPIDLLNAYNNEGISVNQQELEKYKNKIVETLSHYNISIAQIKATVGPTITLYEIVPDAGIRISKIKNLEDDIALSLSAMGIRIIAPMPGKGTIGIEVPNESPRVVSMRSAIASKRFQEDRNMILPIAFGKTISNETFVADLAKMPHLLMAGATGQGKSVGLNAIITSLLYKKHPSELKFVFVDPKKVELTLYSKIERHYLAKLPDSEEAIITDTTKVVNTLNSLCIEMDNRYDLLKNALVRNISEYNDKFKQRKLNPENHHQFLPYIVLIIDEFADLIMTAGKEVELPIARLAQLARAVGIHLIVATQRPSVNVITGIIKANFPARIAFRVTSKIDSRTILDAPGADQLIGRGDMLFSTGNDLIRLQCGFIDTPEVEKICSFIGDQRGYSSAFSLPEYQTDEVDTLSINLNERDSLFDDAARIVFLAQQGSASLLQRKLKLGYNRAGRIVDQLEGAGIVGPFEGSKARQVLVQDEQSLEQLLNKMKEM